MKIKNVVLIISLCLLSLMFTKSANAQAGSASMTIDSCNFGSDGIKFSYDLSLITGNHDHIKVLEEISVRNATMNSQVIHSYNDDWGGPVNCFSSGSCSCPWGQPCPPATTFAATMPQSIPYGTVTARAVFTWDYTVNGNTTAQNVIATATCSIGQPPSQVCGDPGTATSNPTPSSCGQWDCDAGEYCGTEFVGGTPTVRCIPSPVCLSCGDPGTASSSPSPNVCGKYGCGQDQYCGAVTGPSGTPQVQCISSPVCTQSTSCGAPGTATTNPTQSDCGRFGCGSEQYCGVRMAGGTPHVECIQDANICQGGGNQCKELGETCVPTTAPCCAGYECLPDTGTGTQICVGEGFCRIGSLEDCNVSCPEGGICMPVDPENPSAGGVCECAGGNEDMPWNIPEVPTYEGPIINIGNLLKGMYTFLVPLGIMLYGIPTVIANVYKIMTSQGDPSLLKDGKEGLWHGAVGILFIGGVMAIFRILVNTFVGGTL